MKKFLLLAVAAIFAFCVSAQNQPPRNGNGEGHGQGPRLTAKERAERLAKQLELTTDQTAQLEQFYVKQDKTREEMRAKGEGDREAMREKFEKQRKADDAELETILGKEKFQKFVEWREKRQQERNNGNGGGGRGNGGGNGSGPRP